MKRKRKARARRCPHCGESLRPQAKPKPPATPHTGPILTDEELQRAIDAVKAMPLKEGVA